MTFTIGQDVDFYKNKKYVCNDLKTLENFNLWEIHSPVAFLFGIIWQFELHLLFFKKYAWCSSFFISTFEKK